MEDIDNSGGDPRSDPTVDTPFLTSSAALASSQKVRAGDPILRLYLSQSLNVCLGGLPTLIEMLGLQISEQSDE